MQLLLQLYQPLRSQVDVLQQHPATLTHTHGHSKREYIETSETSNLSYREAALSILCIYNIQYASKSFPKLEVSFGKWKISFNTFAVFGSSATYFPLSNFCSFLSHFMCKI